MRFRDKKIVVTGAAGVYGRGLATAFANAGARLALSDVRRDGLEEVKRMLKLPDSRVLLHATELTDAASIQALVTTVVQQWGAPDVVVNNAGVYPFHGLLETNAAQWDRVMDVNLRAPFLIIQGFARAMLERGVKGCFINVSSASADVLHIHEAVDIMASPFAAERINRNLARLEWLTKGFALDLGPDGIRVNAVRPGFAFGGAGVEFPEGYADAIMEANPMRRLGTPADLAEAVMFLASEHASFVTGEVLSADGGSSISRRMGAATEARRGPGRT
jgi:3-oxoacyl-[acyl-carrier protein] reductase